MASFLVGSKEIPAFGLKVPPNAFIPPKTNTLILLSYSRTVLVTVTVRSVVLLYTSMLSSANGSTPDTHTLYSESSAYSLLTTAAFMLSPPTPLTYTVSRTVRHL